MMFQVLDALCKYLFVFSLRPSNLFFQIFLRVFPPPFMSNTNDRFIAVSHQVSVYFPCHELSSWDFYTCTFVLCNGFVYISHSNISKNVDCRNIMSRDCLFEAKQRCSESKTVIVCIAYMKWQKVSHSNIYPFQALETLIVQNGNLAQLQACRPFNLFDQPTTSTIQHSLCSPNEVCVEPVLGCK